MNRSGFALLTVLWAVVALGTVAATAATVARRGHYLTRNRIVLARAGWAREACLSILHARYARDQRIRKVDSVDLGGGAWCSATMHDPAAELNVNLAPPSLLRAALGDTLADALLDWRDADDDARPSGAERDWYRQYRRASPRNGPLADAAELRLIRRFESRPLAGLTTRGDGRINPNLAPIEIVAALPGLDDPVTISALATGRSAGTDDVVRSLDALIGLVPPSARTRLLANYAELQALTVYAPTTLVAHVQGAVGASPPRSNAWLTVIPLGDRLAVVSREAE
jgi:type II secretory pathway component PulK